MKLINKINNNNKIMKWNGNELVFIENPNIGIAGISDGMPDELGEEIAKRWNKGIECEYGCAHHDQYGFVISAGCPIHD
jgi:hypothetical protein